MAVTLTIPESSRILVLDDNQERLDWFLALPLKVDTAKSADEAVKLLAENEYDFVFLDHDLGPDSHYDVPEDRSQCGCRVARLLAKAGFPSEKVMVHSSNSDGAQRMQGMLHGSLRIEFGEFRIRVG